MDEYESVLLIQPEVFVYKIPPRATNRGYRANEWNLENPDWSGRLRLLAAGGGSKCVIKLEDKNSGELFAKAPIDEYPGPAIESVSDSSRYFVLRIMDDSVAAGRTAFIGVGFADRSNAFDLNVTLQDHFKRLKVEQEIEKEKEVPKPALDLGFKEGETIKISMKITKKDGCEGSSKPKAKAGGGGLGGILPPPPAAGPKVSPSASLNISREATPTSSPSHQHKPASGSTTGGEPNSNSSWVQF